MKTTNYLTRKLSKWVLGLALMVLSMNLATAQTTVTIGSGTTTNLYFPIYTCYGYSYSQQIYTASEMLAGGAVSGGQITQIKFFYNSGGTGFANWPSWTVFLGNTALGNLASTSGWVSTASMTQVFNGNIPTPVAGTWLTLNLTTPFTWTGGNLVVAVDENTAGYSCTAAWRSFATTAAAGPRGILYYSDTNNPNPAAPPVANYSNTTTRAQIQMTMTGGAACSGTPTPGNTVASSASTCPANAVNLSLQNTTSGSGVSYQWQSGPSSTGPWTNFGGNVPTASATQSAATWYQCIVTCSGSSGTSNPVQVIMNAFANCYPSSNATSTADEEILGVTVGGVTQTSVCGTLAPGAGSIAYQYSNYKGNTPGTIYKGNTEPFSLNLGYCGSTAYSNVAAIYIDYNQNGSYLDAGEAVYTKAYGALTFPSQVVSGTFIVPATALTGVTGMRVVYVESSTISPNGTYTWGETEDYMINVLPPPPMTITNTNVQQQTAPAASNYGNVPVLRIKVTTSGVTNPLSPDAFTFTTNGTTNVGNILNAKLYYTGATGGNFSATTQYGSTIANPNGTIIFQGSQTLLPGDNFFWLVYDVASGVSGCNNVLDATYENMIVSLTPYTPNTSAPAGSVPVYPNIVAKN
ncbi:MAG: hypothetical protein RL491_1375, partial [Bacteroidota bacterium]